MAITTPNMGLKRWDQPNDIFSYVELSDNFNKLDLHDHTSGKGIQIPTAGIANLAITTSKIAADAVDASKILNGVVSDAKLASPNNSIYRLLLQGAGNYGVAAAGTYLVREGGSTALPATASPNPPAAFYLAASGISVAGKTAVLSLRAQHYQNNIAPAITFTYGLHALTMGTGTSAGPVYAMAAAVAGSTVAIASPAINSQNHGISTDFALPVDGYYALGVVSSGTPAANSSSTFTLQLRVRYI